MTMVVADKKVRRILLCSVFGPYGVDDAYGRKENIMELLHNQVTRGQGIASWRFHHRSYGLYLIAANLDADVLVLDFPSQSRFVEEIKKGYDVIGISFITPNFLKAQKMCQLVREHAPESTLLLGGHGTAIPEVTKLLDCDHLVRGEGIRWMRQFLGQDPEAPIAHPIMPSIERMSAYGVPFPGTGSNLLVTGVGCVNGCRFCSTSHLFSRKYTPFIATGKDLFRTACEIADRNGNTDFYIMDENFLKDPARATELLAEMEKHNRSFTFQIFSSAEAILSFGLDRLVRLGVDLIWIGVEASGEAGNFEKNKGVDAKGLIRQLRDRGIRVLASGILCQEHHTEENIQTDIDFMVDLEADFVQFMLLTSLPVTALYKKHKEQGVLREDLPYEEWHGQKFLNYRNPAFSEEAPERWLKAAFRQDYEMNSSSMYRVVETAYRGYAHLAAMAERDAWLEERLRQLRDKVVLYRTMLPVVARHAVNPLERERALTLDQAITREIGKPSFKQAVYRTFAPFLADLWKIRLRLKGDGMQPATIVTAFRRGANNLPTVMNATACPRDQESLTLEAKAREAAVAP